jgi:integrase
VNDDPDRPRWPRRRSGTSSWSSGRSSWPPSAAGFLTTSPIPDDVAEILPKKRRQKALRFLTEAEVTRLGAFNTPWDVLIYVAAYGDLRLGELAALRVEDFDFLRGTVYVDAAVTDVEGILDYGTRRTRRASGP